MWSAVFLLASSVAIFTQNVSGLKDEPKNAKLEEYVELGGHTYYIESFTDYNFIAANQVCANKNLTLVTFEADEKWDLITNWVAGQPYYWRSFWTGGVRDKNTTRWYWQNTGETIETDHWIEGENFGDLGLINCLIFQTNPLPGWFTGGDYNMNDVICQ